MNKLLILNIDCRQIVADIRRHLVPIAVSVLVSVLTVHTGVGTLILLVAGGALALCWWQGWRISITRRDDRRPDHTTRVGER